MRGFVGKGAGGAVAVVAQCALTLVGLGLVAAMPARSGPMLVVPFTGGPVKPWLDRRSDIRFSGLGRLPGSIIVIDDRDALLGDAIAHGAFLLPASPALCATRLAQAS